MKQENEFSELTPIDLTGLIPERDICAECAKHGQFYAPTETTVVYCPHTLRAATRVLDRPFKIVPGIEREHYISMVSRGVLQGELLRDVNRGITRIVQDQANDSTKH